MTSSESSQEYLTSAADLHEAGYTRRAVHARWVLEAYAVLHQHLTDGGRPLEDDHAALSDSSFYLSPAEWREVTAAAQTIVNLGPIIATGLELEWDGE